LEVLIDPATWAARESSHPPKTDAWDMGRSLFAVNRANVSPADQGALSISCGSFG